MMKIQAISNKFRSNCTRQLALSSLIALASAHVAMADSDSPGSREPLKGGVEDTNVLPNKEEHLKDQIPMMVPVPKKKLEGQADESGRNALKGQAEDESANLQGLNGQADNKVLQGSAQQLEGSASEDPDTSDQQLMVEWDAWRNRFLRAVQSDVQSNLNNSEDTMSRWDPRSQTVIRQFPLGTTAWFKCDIREDLKIVNFQLVKSSGFPNYDRLVMDAVAALNGTEILRFPSKSKRHRVNQMAGIQTASKSSNEYFHFGDIEKYRVPNP
ncbi:MAG TPA: TonB C-terminal domain-containing protein [Drouetiella sp.]|jgi:TonB C terminal